MKKDYKEANINYYYFNYALWGCGAYLEKAIIGIISIIELVQYYLHLYFLPFCQGV